MAGLKELNLLASYHKGTDNIANDFYQPCLERSIKYDRAVGFFSSSIYIIAWNSLRKFIVNGGTIRIVCSPYLSQKDIEAITEGYKDRSNEDIGPLLVAEIERLLSNPIMEKPTKVLASLIALKKIDIKIAYMRHDDFQSSRLFHDKVGIFSDSFGNHVAFKGSMNETWLGLAEDGNLESVDVFVTWADNRDKDRVLSELHYFELIWSNSYPSIETKAFPDIALEALRKIASNTDWLGLVEDIQNAISHTIEPDLNIRKRELRSHQVGALENWRKNHRRGILKHATGSGKTVTALQAIREAVGLNETPLILVPSELLLLQWKKEIEEELCDIHPQILLCGAGNTTWSKNRVLAAWTKKNDASRIVLATMQTASRDAFLKSISQGNHLLLVADEVHKLGSPEHSKIMSLETGPRLGLSATPERHGDIKGTIEIMTYFSGIIAPEFSIEDAIRANILTPYAYYPHFIELRNAEQEEWNEITQNIKKLYAMFLNDKSDNDYMKKKIDNLLIQRARVVKKAENKIPVTVDIIKNYYKQGERWLVYCEDQVQLENVIDVLRTINISCTAYHSAMQGDRQQTIRHFESNGGILISIRCLDEGIDIPSITHALILASSKNPREFIQRRGRVLRKAPNKKIACIHDCLVIPKNIDGSMEGISIIEGELVRALEFSKHAINAGADIELQRVAIRFRLDNKVLAMEGVEDE
jgi:superfamily II DNA or RNA helicase